MSEREATVILTAQTSQYNKELEKSQKSTDALSKSIDKIATSAEKINKATAKGLMRVGTAEIAGLTALSAVAATLEKQTSNIQANLALNKTSSGYNAVTASIRQMSREIPMARAEIAAMTTSVSGLGVTTAKEIGLVSRNFNRMGIATGEAPIGLATSMVQFQRAMGQNPTSYTMEPYQNATTLLSARAGAPAQDILSFAQSIAPASRVAGLSQSSVLGLSTAATRAGVDGTYASSTISQILNDITMLRYTKSPELGRFASALGMDTAALARPTSGPEDQDRFMRGIISQIINVSQSAEGPSRLSMLGYDGLRARKALQGLAQNPGGVEQYIQMAEAGMGSNAMDVGFEAATQGLADEMTMLRNKMTDLGQSLGEPVLGPLTKLAQVTNAVLDPITEMTSVIGGFVSATGMITGGAAIGAGAMLKGWKAMSLVSTGARVGNNIYTDAFRDSVRAGQAIGRGEPWDPAVGRLTGRMDQYTWGQRQVARLGSGFGSMAPNLHRPAGVGQAILSGIDRAAIFASRSMADWYNKAAMPDPQDRLDLKREQDRLRDAYKKERDLINRANAAGARYAPDRWTPIAQPAIPLDPTTRTPLVYDHSGRYTARGVGASIGSAWFGTAERSWRSGLTNAGHLAALPFHRMAENARAAGGWGDYIGGRMARFDEQVGGNIRSGLSSAAGSPMIQMAAITAAAGYLFNERDKASEWSKKWDTEKGGGISDAELDNLSEYNERLGIATRSLTQFSKALDESNPAKSEDINAELRNVGNVRDYGRSMEELVNARLGTIKTVEQAKEWISSQGTMNADQWVLVMRDFSKVFKNNAAAYEELSKWVQANQTNGRVPMEISKGSSSQLGNLYNEVAFGRDNVSNTRSLLDMAQGGRFFGGLIGKMFFGDDISGVRNKSKSALELFVGSQASDAKAIGERKDASSLFGGNARLNEEQQQALVKAETLSSVTAKIVSDAQGIRDLSNPLQSTLRHDRAVALDAYMKAAGSAFDIDLSGINVGGNPEDIKKDLKKKFEEAATYDPSVKAVIDSGLLDEVLAGKPISEGLPDKTVLTSVQQALKGTAFENMPDYDKYFGENSNLGKMIAAYGTDYGDATDFAAASQTLLEASKTIDENAQADKQARARRGDTSAFYEAAGQSYNQRYRQYADLEQMKVGLREGTKGFEVIKAAQAELMRQQQREYNLMNPAEYMASRADMAQTLIGQLNVDANKQSKDLQPQIDALKKEANDFQMDWESKVVDWGISRDREAEDWKRQTVSGKFNMDATYSEKEFDKLSYAEQDFYRSRLYAQEDFQRSMDRSKDSYRRNTEYSEAAFRRSLKYQEQDFYRSREREAKAHSRQMQYTAEDMAKTMADPYRRIETQLVSSPEAIAANMRNRLSVLQNQNAAVERLRGMGLSDRAVQQLDLTSWNNAQQAISLGSTMTPESVEAINKAAESFVASADTLNRSDPNTMRAEKERDIALKQSLEDFLRNLKRTKFEHAVQVKFNKKEFEIGISQAEEDNRISLKRAEEAFNTTMERATSTREKALKRQVEDLFGMGKKGLGEFAKIDETIRGYIDKYGGEFKDDMNSAWESAKSIIKTIDKALEKIKAAREAAEEAGVTSGSAIRSPSNPMEDKPSRRSGGGTFGGRGGAAMANAVEQSSNVPGTCLATVSKWYGGPGIVNKKTGRTVPNASMAWDLSLKKHPGNPKTQKPPAGVPVYWQGGDGHVALSLGGGYIRSTDWPRLGKTGTTTVKTLSDAWSNKTYKGWTEDLWGSGISALGDGGVVTKTTRAVIGERGTAEAVIPLDKRGVDFMVAFQRRLIAEMMGSTIPRTQPTVVNNVTNNTSQMSIEKVEVTAQDPKEFARQMQQEQSKKRAALYKA